MMRGLTGGRVSRRLMLMALVGLLAVVPLAAQMAGPDKADLDAIYRIKDEGLQRSQVMELMSYATDVFGARLTGSPYRQPFVDWVRTTMTGWGLKVQTEPLPAFGRGWANERFSAHVVSGQPFPLIGYPKAWTPGTNGTVTGEAVIATIANEQDLEKYRGKLKGKIVLSVAKVDLTTPFDPLARRYTANELESLSQQPGAAAGRRPGGPGGPFVDRSFRQKLNAFYLEEGVAAVFDAGRGEAGTVLVGSGGSQDPKAPPVPCQVTLTAEHYNRIYRMAEKKVPVTIELNVQNRFTDNGDVFNIIGELPGTDKADEVVIIGGHWDSWHAGTGAADNAAGFITMMEAMRILKASGLKMRRTVRVALWDGEEQGLLGSRAYVAQHYADRATMALKPEHAKMAGYYNIDNGTGAIRGVYLQGNEAVAPVFQQWMEPFRNMGMTTLAIRNTGGTDHQSFDAVGLPGFQFVQDPVQYGRTYHTNMDVYERIEPTDMMRNAVIVASFVYHTANRDQVLPRKPLPKPAPAGQRPF